jgi:hypothetical protein
MWVQSGVVFVTINNPGGSNNDADPWYGTPAASPQQITEAANRTAADLRWLDRAFSTATSQHARSLASRRAAPRGLAGRGAPRDLRRLPRRGHP